MLDFADTCVFAKQSLGPILCGLLPLPSRKETSSTRGSPSPEVTGTFCRVPSPQFTRAPEASRLAYVCPFPVRSVHALPTEAFLGSLPGSTRVSRRKPSHSALDSPGLFSPGSVYHVGPGRPIARLDLRSCVPPVGHNAHELVQDYSPDSHRLRPSAST